MLRRTKISQQIADTANNCLGDYKAARQKQLG
jgi:hypothetical protein